MTFFGQRKVNLHQGELYLGLKYSGVWTLFRETDLGYNFLALYSLDTQTTTGRVVEGVRIPLTREERNHLGVGRNDEVIVLGAGDRLEVWRPGDYMHLREEYWPLLVKFLSRTMVHLQVPSPGFEPRTAPIRIKTAGSYFIH